MDPEALINYLNSFFFGVDGCPNAVARFESARPSVADPYAEFGTYDAFAQHVKSNYPFLAGEPKALLVWSPVPLPDELDSINFFVIYLSETYLSSPCNDIFSPLPDPNLGSSAAGATVGVICA
jgi:hypothetical protein